MARKIRMEFNSSAVAELLSSEPMQEDLKRRAEAIAEAANQATPSSDSPAFVAESWVAGGSSKLSRAMAKVRTANYEGRKAEAEDRVLERALDAGR